MMRDATSIQQRGYGYLGVATFEGGGRASEAQLREQAARVGADVVLSKIAFEGSQTSAVPWVAYNPGPTSTTTTNGVVNANVTNNQGGSARGTAVYSGSSTTTSSGTYSTQMIPVTVNRYSWEATFWRKLLPQMLGVRVDSLSDELRKKHERNTGVVVMIVSDDSLLDPVPPERRELLGGNSVFIWLGPGGIQGPQNVSVLVQTYRRGWP